LPRFLKAGRRKALIINSSYDLNHSPSPILHAIPLRFSLPVIANSLNCCLHFEDQNFFPTPELGKLTKT
jgi:hypothetical protein